MPMKTEHDFVAEVARQVNYAAKSFIKIRLTDSGELLLRIWIGKKPLKLPISITGSSVLIMASSIFCRSNASMTMDPILHCERRNKMEIADYRTMSSFELIDRINNTVTWDDEENEPCMRELCERYNVDFDAYDNYEDIWDQIIRKVYDDVVIHHQYAINNRDYTIAHLESDKYFVYAVVVDIYEKVMFDVYEIGTMQECKKYVKERIDID